MLFWVEIKSGCCITRAKILFRSRFHDAYIIWQVDLLSSRTDSSDGRNRLVFDILFFDNFILVVDGCSIDAVRNPTGNSEFVKIWSHDDQGFYGPLAFPHAAYDDTAYDDVDKEHRRQDAYSNHYQRRRHVLRASIRISSFVDDTAAVASGYRWWSSKKIANRFFPANNAMR
mmetsp:Transcript_3929/g.9365  ORF Transcript_3929/g.9365 Transcript_3929/m.9365 type:complete len:172 (-) Transcript_3929:40-555(-)